MAYLRPLGLPSRSMLAPQQTLRPDAGKACAHTAHLLLHLVNLGAERGRSGLELGHGAAHLIHVEAELTHLRPRGQDPDPLLEKPLGLFPGDSSSRTPWTRRSHGGIDRALNVLQHPLPG